MRECAVTGRASGSWWAARSISHQQGERTMNRFRRTAQLAAVAAVTFGATGATAIPERQTSIEELLARIAPQPVGVYVTIEGSKQGKFKAENPREKHQGKI